MSHIAGPDRSQTLLLPEALDDYVAPDNPVRFIDAFVDGLDLTNAGFANVEPKPTGRPGYAPGDLLKLYVYGYLNRVRSSRRLEAETHRNVEVIWLLRHLQPDFENLGAKIAALQTRRDRYAQMQVALEQSGEDQISLTDPDSRAMAAHTRVAVGYNAQIAVDAKHKLIVEQQITNQVVDMGLLTETATAAKDILGVDRIAATADKGYFKIEDIEACEAAGIDPYVPRPQRGPSVRAGLFRKDEFRYDPDGDTLLCPAGQRLQPYSSSLMRGLRKINYVNKPACGDCPIRSRCTHNDFRAVSRLENEAVLDRMAARMARNPDIVKLRRELVEHPFGSIKQWMNQGAFLMRRLHKVRAEFSLTALAYNLRRVLNVVDFTTLLAAVQG